MKRTEKYPDTDTFKYHNENPKNRITGDCTFRAIATTDTSYRYAVAIGLALDTLTERG